MQYEEEQLLLLLMASVMVLLQLLMENEDLFDEDEEVDASKRRRIEAAEETPTSIWPIAVQLSCAVMAFCSLQQGAWWVKERSLIWHDYFLMHAFEDFRWRSCVAVPRDIFMWMVQVLSPRLKLQDTHWRRPVPVDVKLAACLHRLVSGSSYFLCSDRFGIGCSTLQEQMPFVLDAIIQDLGPLFLKWPEADEAGRISQAFYRRCGLPNIAGAIDGSHIKIKNPERRHASDYFNRKRDQSIVLQAICDSDNAFLDISCSAPGSVHDMRCLRLSSFFRRVEAGDVLIDPVQTINEGFQLRPYLLGDQGYAMQPWLMIPFSIHGRSSASQQMYNRKHVTGRLCIERSFGLLKARFRILENGITSSVAWAAKLVHATCILHNIIVKNQLGHDDISAVLEPTIRRERAARNLRRRQQGRPNSPDSGHDVREALVSYVAS
ncbi:hypothetical protein R1sor_010106 [Riccia sorocarpa]|uniref:DDE Tnp4 domain-containing protein n=1 Tax=Riccia sorocarpa TaxID=122646 RepID=A0ABD3HX12_9MARC